MRSVKIHFVGAALLLLPLSVRAADSPDAWITSKAKVAVLSSVGTEGTKIHVDTNDGLVTLYGTVSSNDDKTAAEDAVLKLDGVKQVRNLLEVVEPKKQDVVAASDDDVAKRAKAALRDDPTLKNETGIKVESVDKGTVVLSGNASSLSNHLRAIEDVRRVRGVRRVASTIDSPDSKLARESMMSSAGHSSAAKSGSVEAGDRKGDVGSKPATAANGGGTSDAYITAKAKSRLFVDRKTPATSINVDTEDGVVTLFGTVPDAAAKKEAEAEVRKVGGVKRVENELEIVPKDRAKQVSERDTTLERNVKRAVADDASLSKANISVEVQNGVARLTGKVPDETARKTAEKVAKETDGVKSVRNDIRVSSD
jgi:hyperosmotically inducible protein